MNILKPAIICVGLLTLQACGGGTNPGDELEQKNQDTNLDITDGNDLIGGGDDTGKDDDSSDQEHNT